jgi:hypothetical protein
MCRAPKRSGVCRTATSSNGGELDLCLVRYPGEARRESPVPAHGAISNSIPGLRPKSSLCHHPGGNGTSSTACTLRGDPSAFQDADRAAPRAVVTSAVASTAGRSVIRSYQLIGNTCHQSTQWVNDMMEAPSHRPGDRGLTARSQLTGEPVGPAGGRKPRPRQVPKPLRSRRAHRKWARPAPLGGERRRRADRERE